MCKKKGGGVKGFLNNVKENCRIYNFGGIPNMILRQIMPKCIFIMRWPICQDDALNCLQKRFSGLPSLPKINLLIAPQTCRVVDSPMQ